MRSARKCVRRGCAVAVVLTVGCISSTAAGDRSTYEVTAVLGVDSTSVFRGTKSQKLNPSVYGVFEIERGEIYGGIYASPTSIQNELTSLLVGYWGYTQSVAGVDWTVGGRYYSFPGTSDFAFDLDNDGTPEKIGRKGLLEVYLKAKKSLGPVTVAMAGNFSPDTFGETGKAYYVVGSADIDIGDGFELRGHLGRSLHEDQIYNDNYTDYAAGVYKSLFGLDLFLRYSNTAGLAGADNSVFVFGVEKAWTVASSEIDYDRYLRHKIRNDIRIDKLLLRGGD